MHPWTLSVRAVLYKKSRSSKCLREGLHALLYVSRACKLTNEKLLKKSRVRGGNERDVIVKVDVSSYITFQVRRELGPRLYTRPLWSMVI